MNDRARARAWRSAALLLASGWIVLACGGGDELPAPEARSGASAPGQQQAHTAASAQPLERAAAWPAAEPSPTRLALAPCDAGPAQPSAARAAQKAMTAAAFEAELAAVVEGARALHAGTVEEADPFEDR